MCRTCRRIFICIDIDASNNMYIKDKNSSLMRAEVENILTKLPFVKSILAIEPLNPEQKRIWMMTKNTQKFKILEVNKKTKDTKIKVLSPKDLFERIKKAIEKSDINSNNAKKLADSVMDISIVDIKDLKLKDLPIEDLIEAGVIPEEGLNLKVF